jgi:hypothetical protein
MKLGPAILFVCVGIWITYNYPEAAQQAYVYIEFAFQWLKQTFNSVFGGG